MTVENTAQTEQPTTQPTAEAPARESSDLTINDLNAMKVIIDVASSRGAFKPAEMMLVGQTYSKLSAFLDGVSKAPTQGA